MHTPHDVMLWHLTLIRTGPSYPDGDKPKPMSSTPSQNGENMHYLAPIISDSEAIVSICHTHILYADYARRPFLASECGTVAEAEKWRRQVSYRLLHFYYMSPSWPAFVSDAANPLQLLQQVTRKIAAIQNGELTAHNPSNTHHRP